MNSRCGKNIYSFNAESEPELHRINRVAARLKKIAPVAVRVNPGVEAHTHAKITTGTYENKFGIQFEQVEGVYARAARLKNLRLRGLQMHIGSQITDVAPFEQAVRKVLPLVRRLKEKYALEFFSIGGGLGIVYQPALASGAAAWWKTAAAKNILTPEKYAARLVPLLQPLGLKILIEPGRFIAGNAGILVTRVEYVKRTGQKEFRHRGRGDERFDPPGVLRRLSRNRSAREKGRNDNCSSDVVGGDLRIRRLFLQGPAAAESRRGRLSRADERGRVWFCAGVKLQRAPAGRRNSGERRKIRRRARTPAGERNLVGRESCGMVEVEL